MSDQANVLQEGVQVSAQFRNRIEPFKRVGRQ